MQDNKVISIVLNNFTNDTRVLKEAQSLSKNDFNVTVVALQDEGLKEKETLDDNLSISRLKLKTRSLPKRRFFQLIKYFEFFYKVVVKYRNKINIIHCNDLSALPMGVFIKVLSKNRIYVVYDAHEYETERDAMPIWLKHFLKFFERRLIKYTSKIFTVSDSIANAYKNDYNIEKPALVLNCPKYKEIKNKNNIFREKLNIAENKKIFLYQGGLKSGRGIEILLDAFKNIKNENIVIVFMGFGPLKKDILEARKEHQNIYFYDAVSPEILLEHTNSADYGILFYEDTCLNHRYCSPNKIFEYFMAEIPVIVSNLYEMKRLVETYNVGEVAVENNSSGFIEALENISLKDYDLLVENVKKIKQKYNWEEQERVMLDEYKSL
ncbi:glycosyltransferase [Halarcobacter sp.]|uniref:glycosyltransferase n=1 Tax=Halarcobacter sp. TaxID=2321133 RepID=UPI003A8D48B5